MTGRTRVFAHSFLWIWLGLFGCISYASAENTANAPDVRIIIDISGSMKQNDPQNLRRPALELLVQLLPEGSKAGVWTFGQWVNMLVPHGQVDEAWRQQAMNSAQQINSVGLLTNIPLALEKSLDDLDWLDASYNSSVILLTDGMVDVSKQTAENDTARAQLIDNLLPRLRDAGVTVHTVALSENADQELLDRLALDTNGLSAVAKTADDLTDIFLRAFDAAAPAEQLPLDGNQFLVDSSVEEFTVLVFRQPGSEDTRLLSPDQKTYSETDKAAGVNWFRKANYDLVTVRDPYEGEWTIQADIAPNSRVTVVSNLSLQVDSLPKTLFVDNQTTLTAELREQGVVVNDAQLLSLLSTEVVVTREQDGEQWRQTMARSDARFLAGLGMLKQPGTYDVRVVIDGNTFQRAQQQRIQVRDNFSIDVQASATDPRQYQLELFALNPAIDSEQVEVVAKIRAQGMDTRIATATLVAARKWRLAVTVPTQLERIEVAFDLSGKYRNGVAFSTATEPVVVGAAVAKATASSVPTAVETEPAAIAEPVPETAPEPEPVTEPETKPEPESAVTEEENAQGGWQTIGFYAAIAAGNLLLIAACYLAWRMLRGGVSSSALETEDKMIKPEPAATATAAVAAAAAPMADDAIADLEEAEPELEPESEPEPDPEPEPDLQEQSEAEPMVDDEGEALEAAAPTAMMDDVDLDLDTPLPDDAQGQDSDQGLDMPMDLPTVDEETKKPDAANLMDLPDDAIDIDPESDDED